MNNQIILKKQLSNEEALEKLKSCEKMLGHEFQREIDDLRSFYKKRGHKHVVVTSFGLDNENTAHFLVTHEKGSFVTRKQLTKANADFYRRENAKRIVRGMKTMEEVQNEQSDT